MKNEVQGSATLHLISHTEMDEQIFTATYHEDAIIDTKLQVTLPDGSVHIIDAYLTGLEWNEFINNKKEKATEQNAK